MLFKSNKKSEWIDVSILLYSGMVHWPGDPPVNITRRSDMNKGANHNISSMTMGSHTGTHMDAPLHFIKNGKGLDQLPLSATIGKARVIEIKDKVSITPEELQKHKIRKGERILFKTWNSPRCWKQDKFFKDFVYISKEAAAYLAKKKIQTVGVDYLSVGGYKIDSAETHLAFLGGGIWIIEGLNLTGIKQGDYELICLPLRIINSDGAPARAVLRRI